MSGEAKLNDAQRRAVEHGEGPLLIVAGAGTGKTTVITQRILWLIEQKKARPEEILALTFTEKATEEMVTRVDRLMPYGYTDLWISTFHSFCERVLRDHGLEIGLPTDFRLLNQADAWVLVRRYLDRFELDHYRPLGNPTKFIRALLTHFSRCKDEAIGPEEYLMYANGLRLDRDMERPHPSPLLSGEGTKRPPLLGGEGGGEVLRINELANAYHVYQQLLVENSALDFGDLLHYTLKLFRDRPSILAQYRARFQYLLVDEFQDTNWVQNEIVKMVASPRNNVTVVGDDDQAIYRWRGASMSNILQFKDAFPNATEIVLTENYRSSQNILDLAYNFIQHNNPNRLEARLKTPKRLTAARTGAATIEHLANATEIDEAKAIAQKILALRTLNDAPAWGDISILIRANSQADSFMRTLERHGIPYQFLASRGLYAKPVVLDCIAFLTLCDNYHESTSLFRLLQSPVVGMADADVMRLMHEAGKKNKSAYALAREGGVPEMSPEGKQQLIILVTWIDRGSGLARTKTVGEVLFTFLEASGYLAELTKILQHPGQKSSFAMEEVQYVKQFYDEIASFERTETEPTVKRFLESLSVRIEAGDEGALRPNMESESPDTVKIMTVHGAKGLEFRYVFLPQLVELRFPSVNRKDPIDIPDALVKEILSEGDAHVEEERRLFYVAMTRAKDGLFFTTAEDYGGMRKKRPSVFLSEAGIIKSRNQKIIESKDQKSKKSQEHTALLEEYRGVNMSKKDTTQLKLPEQFSFTQLMAFQTCPLQYKFAHILKVPVRGKFTFSFGKSMHGTMEKFFRRIMEGQQKEQRALFTESTEALKHRSTIPSIDELLKIYDAEWIDEWYESKKHEEEYYDKGKKLLKEFYEMHESKWPTPIAIEQPFTIRVGTYTLKGKIDRIDATADGAGVGLVDYKTGNAPKNTRDLEKDQLLLYQLAVDTVMDKPATSLTYYYFDGQQSFSFIGTDDDVERLKKTITSTIHDIEASDFQATPSPMICRNCDFKEICEYRQLGT